MATARRRKSLRLFIIAQQLVLPFSLPRGYCRLDNSNKILFAKNEREMRLYIWQPGKLSRIVLLFILLRLVYEWIRDQTEVRFSTEVFWKNNRTVPQPVRTIDEVNLTESSFVVAACCRNVRRHLPAFRTNLEAIGKLFRSTRFFFAESDSNDGTLEFLQQWQRNQSDQIFLHTSGSQRLRMFFREQSFPPNSTRLDERIFALGSFKHDIIHCWVLPSSDVSRNFSALDNSLLELIPAMGGYGQPM